MAEKLGDEQIKEALGELTDWKRSGDAIRKTYGFKSFRDAVVFVNRVATIADESNHHPDIDIRYDKVHLTLSTHSAGGLTRKDLELARQIDFATSAR